MTFLKKIVSLAAGLSVLLASFAPVTARALGTASMTLSGASNNNGNFAVTVYENTNSDTVTTVYLQLAFSQAVGNLSYDYSVGPFATATPSGAHVALGSVTGQNPVARVSFTLANPGTVTASVAGSSFMKHANDDSTVENFVIDRGSDNFMYTAPVTGGSGGGDTQAGSNSGSANSASSAPATTGNRSSNSNASNANAVAGDETKAAESTSQTTAKKDDTKQLKTEKADSKTKKSGNGWVWLLIALAVVAGFVAARRRQLQAALIARKAKATHKQETVKKKTAPAIVTKEKPAAVAKSTKTAKKGVKAKAKKTGKKPR